MGIIHIFMAFSLFTSEVVHPLKMTTSKLVITDESPSIELTTNFFFDDFRAHLLNTYMIDIEGSGNEGDEIIADYINQNFQIAINNESISLNFQSREMLDENVVQVKMQGEKSINTSESILKITNTLLLDAFPKEQENIVHLKVDDASTKILHFSIQETIQKVEF